METIVSSLRCNPVILNTLTHIINAALSGDPEPQIPFYSNAIIDIISLLQNALTTDTENQPNTHSPKTPKNQIIPWYPLMTYLQDAGVPAPHTERQESVAPRNDSRIPDPKPAVSATTPAEYVYKNDAEKKFPEETVAWLKDGDIAPHLLPIWSKDFKSSFQPPTPIGGWKFSKTSSIDSPKIPRQMGEGSHQYQSARIIPSRVLPENQLVQVFSGLIPEAKQARNASPGPDITRFLDQGVPVHFASSENPQRITQRGSCHLPIGPSSILKNQERSDCLKPRATKIIFNGHACLSSAGQRISDDQMYPFFANPAQVFPHSSVPSHEPSNRRRHQEAEVASNETMHPSFQDIERYGPDQKLNYRLQRQGIDFISNDHAFASRAPVEPISGLPNRQPNYYLPQNETDAIFEGEACPSFQSTKAADPDHKEDGSIHHQETGPLADGPIHFADEHVPIADEQMRLADEHLRSPLQSMEECHRDQRGNGPRQHRETEFVSDDQICLSYRTHEEYDDLESSPNLVRRLRAGGPIDQVHLIRELMNRLHRLYPRSPADVSQGVEQEPLASFESARHAQGASLSPSISVDEVQPRPRSPQESSCTDDEGQSVPASESNRTLPDSEDVSLADVRSQVSDRATISEEEIRQPDEEFLNEYCSTIPLDEESNRVTPRSSADTFLWSESDPIVIEINMKRRMRVRNRRCGLDDAYLSSVHRGYKFITPQTELVGHAFECDLQDERNEVLLSPEWEATRSPPPGGEMPHLDLC